MISEPHLQIPAITLKLLEAGDPIAAACRFGGDPNLAKAIPWPKDAAGHPMHHLMQIDCASLPGIDPDFPQDGTLFLFVTGSSEERNAPEIGLEPGASSLIHVPEGAGRAPARPHPDDAPPLGEYSLAMEPVIIPVEPKPKGLLPALFNTQPKKYSKSATNSFAPVALEPVLFDSHPAADPVALYQKLDEPMTEDTPIRGIRPHQMLGYAPALADLLQTHAEGYMPASIEKGEAAMALAEARQTGDGDAAPVLLFQLSRCEKRNFEYVSWKFVIKILIRRGDLRARAFDRHWAVLEQVHEEGAWRSPKPQPILPDPFLEKTHPAVILKSLVPGEAAASPSNYFGGLPQLPDHIDWPVNDKGAPLHFVMQLDCATIPREMKSGEDVLSYPPFPKRGALFLFANAVGYDLFQNSANAVRLVHTMDDVCHLPHRQPPPSLPMMPPYGVWDMEYRDEAPDLPEVLQDITTHAMARAWEPRRPFEPIPVATFEVPDEHEDRKENFAAYWETLRQVLPHEPTALRYTQYVLNWLPNWYRLFLKRQSEHWRCTEVIRNVPESYPWRWADIREAIESFASSLPGEPEDEEDEKAREHLWPEDFLPQAKEWYARAAENDFLDRIDPATSAEFRAWLKGLDAAAQKIPAEHADESNSEYRWRKTLECVFRGTLTPFGLVKNGMTQHWLLHDPQADDYPKDMRRAAADMLRFRRSFTELPADNTTHSPSIDQLFAASIFEREDRQGVLLFEIGGSYPLQIWIDPEDLVAQRFDRIRPQIR